MPRPPKAMVSAKVCGTCVHFKQHYILTSKGEWMSLWYGHCAFPKRIQHRNPGETCEKWQEREE